MTAQIVLDLERLSGLISAGEFQPAHEGCLALLDKVSKEFKGNPNYYILLFNLSGLLIDIGAMQPNADATSTGLKLLTENESEIVRFVDKSAYFYNLSNGASNQIEIGNPLKQTFHSIERLVELKNYIWKAVKYSQEESGAAPHEYKVNLANALQKQFRLVEALSYYDEVNRHGLDIPQAWINRSHALMVLNQVSNTYTIRMLEEVRDGYLHAINSSQVPPVWKETYRQQVEWHTKKIEDVLHEEGITADNDDHAKTLAEYDQLSAYRKFCLERNITLSEHALYCRCAGSARDNLTIPTTSGISGDFVVPMEMVLNRLKSEFSFARDLYYEYLTNSTPDDIQHELCFSELFDDEVLGIDIEKIRTAFRACFSILDKIGAAICELYGLYPAKDGHVYFQNMWRLDSDGRRDKFEAVKNPGLLALYSTATDLNENKDGEWAFYKSWRNDLEHKFVVVHKGEKPSDVYASHKFMRDLIFIREPDFIWHFGQLLQLTRSAIFSFAFSVRERGLAEKRDGVIYKDNEIPRRNFSV